VSRRNQLLGQLRELLTRYGPIGGIWLDGWSERFSDQDLEEIYALVRTLQPKALVATNHHRQPLPNEDFQIFESAFPGDRSPKSLRTPVSRLHHEIAMKLARTWFWSPFATISNTRMNRLIERAERRGESLLLDIPPRSDGSFDSSVWQLTASPRRGAG
jgi:alpha-L-fucosidase